MPKGYHAKAPSDPAKRLGVWKTIAEVPPRRRLEQFAAAYEDRDVFGEWCDAEMDLPNRSDSTRTKVGLAEKRWKAHTDESGVHHALATPDDVESWLSHLANDRGFTTRTVYSSYFVYIEQMFTWLTYRTDHVHTYNPAILAAVAGGVAGEIWDFKTGYARHPEEYHNGGDSA
jgi:hypothetical protein